LHFGPSISPTIAGRLSGLNDYAANVYSQNGEDGILARLLELIGERNGWCIEFGAWDGLHLSNCANLIRNNEYSGVLIEADERRFAELESNYRDNPGVTTIRASVGFNLTDGLDALVSEIAMPDDPDVLSIDIDGNDYHVWSAVEHVRARIVCVEFNPTIPNAVDFVQTADRSVHQGCGVRSLVRLGKEKGYELACCTVSNALFVDARYFPQLEIANNSIDALRDDSRFVTYLFCGYDGRILLDGYRRVLWHGIPMSERKVQQLPRFLIGYPDDYSAVQRVASRLYKFLVRLRRALLY
jgi:hypothetical protein